MPGTPGGLGVWGEGLQEEARGVRIGLAWERGCWGLARGKDRADSTCIFAATQVEWEGRFACLCELVNVKQPCLPTPQPINMTIHPPTHHKATHQRRDERSRGAAVAPPTTTQNTIHFRRHTAIRQRTCPPSPRLLPGLLLAPPTTHPPDFHRPHCPLKNPAPPVYLPNHPSTNPPNHPLD